MRAARLACLAVATLCGCASSAAGPQEDERCISRVWYRPDRALARPDLSLTSDEALAPELIGSWHGFSRPGLRQFAQLDGENGERFLTVSLPLPPGPHEYAILVGNSLLIDDIEPQSSFGRDFRFSDSGPYDAEFTRVEVADCNLPTLRSAELSSSTNSDGNGTLRWVAEFRPGVLEQDLDVSSLSVTLRRGEKTLPPPNVSTEPPSDDGIRRIIITAANLLPSKYSLTLSARAAHAADGRSPPPLSASIFVEPQAVARGDNTLKEPRPQDDAVVYQLIIDRFRGPTGALPSPTTPGHRAGGTLDGVRAAIAAGYFERLGVTTLWLSPLYQNPIGFFVGRDGRNYEAYHGYWPIAPRTVEPRFGGEDALRSVVEAAHARGLRVIFDAVPNHVHAQHPYYRDHSRQNPPIEQAADAAARSWFHDGEAACVCGAPGCSWGDRIEDCWFALYLPDLNWRHPEVMQAGVDDLLWWLDKFDLDGMRIDAVPMMPRAASRRIVRATHRAVARGGLDLLLLGEDYTGPGQAGRVDIRSFLGRAYDGLDSAFDFPLMWAIRDAIAQEHSGLDELEREITHSAAAWAGSGAVMAHMLNNHDTPRFISEAAGNAGNDPWQDPPPQPPTGDSETYRKHMLGIALLLTLPGIPVIYYGDEVGLAGANDPDSRRVLPDVLAPKALPAIQTEVLDLTGRLGRLRACSTTLRRGQRQVVSSAADYTVALHTHASAPPLLVAISRARVDQRIAVAEIPPGRYRNLLSPTAPPLVVAEDGAATLVLSALRPTIYLREDDPCYTERDM